jgi:hypothetical protein
MGGGGTDGRAFDRSRPGGIVSVKRKPNPEGEEPWRPMFLNYLLNKTLYLNLDGRADFKPRFVPDDLQVS